MKDSKPVIDSRDAESLYLDLVRVTEMLSNRVNGLLRPHGLTKTQYNVMRILRGAGRQGLACQEISTRLVTPVPDVTRILDRMEQMKLIRRWRDEKDRRKVFTVLTEEGRELVHALDNPIAQFHQIHLGQLTKKDQKALKEQLKKVWNILQEGDKKQD